MVPVPALPFLVTSGDFFADLAGVFLLAADFPATAAFLAGVAAVFFLLAVVDAAATFVFAFEGVFLELASEAADFFPAGVLAGDFLPEAAFPGAAFPEAVFPEAAFPEAAFFLAGDAGDAFLEEEDAEAGAFLGEEVGTFFEEAGAFLREEAVDFLTEAGVFFTDAEGFLVEAGAFLAGLGEALLAALDEVFLVLPLLGDTFLTTPLGDAFLTPPLGDAFLVLLGVAFDLAGVLSVLAFFCPPFGGPREDAREKTRTKVERGRVVFSFELSRQLSRTHNILRNITHPRKEDKMSPMREAGTSESGKPRFQYSRTRRNVRGIHLDTDNSGQRETKKNTAAEQPKQQESKQNKNICRKPASLLY